MKRLLAAMVAALLMVSLVSSVTLAAGGNSANAKLCQKGGYLTLVGASGQTFATQGACVSYGAQGGILSPKPATGSITIVKVISSTNQGPGFDWAFNIFGGNVNQDTGVGVFLPNNGPLAFANYVVGEVNIPDNYTLVGVVCQPNVGTATNGGTGTAYLTSTYPDWTCTVTNTYTAPLTANLYDVTASPSTTWNCALGATNTTGGTRGTVTWSTVGGTVIVNVSVVGGLRNATYDVWVEQNPGTCPLGTSTPSNPGALVTDASGNGTATFSFTAVSGATNFWLSLWSPAGSQTGISVLRSTAVTLY